MIRLLLLLLFTSSALAKIPADYAGHLHSKGKVGIAQKDCKEMEEKMGQLMYINVDGFGSKYTIDPAYDKLVKRIQAGGVLPKYNSKNPKRIRSANTTLQKISKQPLMIGVDYITLKSNGRNVRAGLGHGAGISEEIGEADIACYEKVASIDAALHKYLGINNPLGPTIENTTHFGGILGKEFSYKQPRLGGVVDQFRNMGLETTIKHFPYTPSDFNLHSGSPDTLIDEEVVDRDFMPIFNNLAGKSGILMTTHLYNSKVDPNNMATFSKKWMKKLREEVGFNGLVMTDALFMIDGYSDTMKQMAADWPVGSGVEDDFSIFAIKSILVGHDMFFLETAASKTESIWKDLVKFSCTDSPLAKQFRDRVKESHNRIMTYKKSNPQLAVLMKELKQDDLDELLRLRKSPSEICALSEDKIKDILIPFAGVPTNIGEDIFSCMQVHSGNVVDIIKRLSENIDKTLVASDLFASFSYVQGDDLLQLIDLINQNPKKRDELLELAKSLLHSRNIKEATQAMDILTKLDGWNGDSTFVDSFIKNENIKLLQTYAYFAQRGSIPLPSKEMQFKGLELASKSILDDQIPLIEAILPLPSKSTIGIRQLMDLKLKGKTKSLALLRTQAPVDVSQLTQDEVIQIIEQTTDEDFLYARVNSEFVWINSNTGEREYNQAPLRPYSLVYTIGSNFKFSNVDKKALDIVREARKVYFENGMNTDNQDLLILRMGKRSEDLSTIVDSKIIKSRDENYYDSSLDGVGQAFKIAAKEGIPIKDSLIQKVKDTYGKTLTDSEVSLYGPMMDFIRNNPEKFPEPGYDKYKQ